MNQMMMAKLNPLQINQIQLMQMNQINQNQIPINQIPMNPIPINPMSINQFNQFNQMNQINQMNQFGRIPMPVQNQFIQPGMPIMPMSPLYYQNPFLAQQIYQQTIQQQNEIQRLNQNYEYQLKRHKEAELYKVVNDKKVNKNK